MTSRFLPALEMSRKKEKRVCKTGRFLPVLEIFRKKEKRIGMTSRFLPVDFYQSWKYLKEYRNSVKGLGELQGW
jgi:hypothetical protein